MEIYLQGIEDAIEKLGLNGADSKRGALELLAFEIKEGSERIESALQGIESAIREHQS